MKLDIKQSRLRWLTFGLLGSYLVTDEKGRTVKKFRRFWDALCFVSSKITMAHLASSPIPVEILQAVTDAAIPLAQARQFMETDKK